MSKLGIKQKIHNYLNRISNETIVIMSILIIAIIVFFVILPFPVFLFAIIGAIICQLIPPDKE